MHKGQLGCTSLEVIGMNMLIFIYCNPGLAFSAFYSCVFTLDLNIELLHFPSHGDKKCNEYLWI